MAGRVTSERMTQLRQQSKLRERLVREVEDLDERLQVAYIDINLLVEENIKITRQVITYDARQRLRRKLAADMEAKRKEIASFREQLAMAVQELDDYDETTQIR